ncbi:MAG: hypothetical protein LBL05_00065 [Synergistaceae bacterium]|jgi:outer membrane biosynthesis protein TonB|nr:hypothetical protein [Synergistaceae bacterium]
MPKILAITDAMHSYAKSVLSRAGEIQSSHGELAKIAGGMTTYFNGTLPALLTQRLTDMKKKHDALHEKISQYSEKIDYAADNYEWSDKEIASWMGQIGQEPPKPIPEPSPDPVPVPDPDPVPDPKPRFPRPDPGPKPTKPAPGDGNGRHRPRYGMRRHRHGNWRRRGMHKHRRGNWRENQDGNGDTSGGTQPVGGASGGTVTTQPGVTGYEDSDSINDFLKAIFGNSTGGTTDSKSGSGFNMNSFNSFWAMLLKLLKSLQGEENSDFSGEEFFDGTDVQ